MELVISCNTIFFRTSLLIDSFEKTEIYFNNLKQADNSASCLIPYNVEIQNFINAYADNEIKAEIKEGNNYLFSGYLRNNFSFSKKQKNQPIKIEIVSPSFLLDKDLPINLVMENTTIGKIVDEINNSIGITSNARETATEPVLFFSANEGDNIKEILNTLVYEYGYCYDFNSKGDFIIYQVFNVPDKWDNNYNTFDGSNCLDEIKISKKENEFDNVLVNWAGIKGASKELIFADTTEGNSQNYTCNIVLQPDSYLGEGEKSYFINYDYSKGKVLFVKNATLITNSNNNSGLEINFKNLGNKGELSIYNKTSSPITITKINVIGDFFYEAGVNKTSITLGKKTKEYTSKYLQIKENVKNFCEKYSDYLKYSDYKITLKSKDNYNLGSFVKITEYGLGTIFGRIIKKKTTLKNKIIQYEVEAVSEYEKAIATTKENQNGQSQKVGKDGADSVNILLDRNTLIYNAANDGTIEENTITTNVILTKGNENPPFKIDEIKAPEGFLINTDGSQITITALKGNKMQNNGVIRIPISYAPIEKRNLYLDENDFNYTDDLGINYSEYEFSDEISHYDVYLNYLKSIQGDSGAAYLGVKENIYVITEKVNIGDYFICSTFDYEKKRARIYKCKEFKKNKDPVWELVECSKNPELYNLHINDLISLVEPLPDNDEVKIFVNSYVGNLLNNTTFVNDLFSNKAFTDNLNKFISK